MKNLFCIIILLISIMMAFSVTLSFICELNEISLTVLRNSINVTIIVLLLTLLVLFLIEKYKNKVTITMIITGYNESIILRILNIIFFNIFLIMTSLFVFVRYLNCNQSCNIYFAAFLIVSITVVLYVILEIVALIKKITSKNGNDNNL